MSGLFIEVRLSKTCKYFKDGRLEGWKMGRMEEGKGGWLEEGRE